MATHDYSIANATGAAFRADLNSALLAIVTTNSSSVAPSVPYAGMLWTDLSAGGDGIVKRRNAANTAWLTDIGVDSTARAAAAAAQSTADAAVKKAGDTMTGPLTLPAADPVGYQAMHKAYGDATFQTKLLAPVAGSLLLGAAGGWTSKLDPGLANSLLAIVGGLPTWQLTAQAASPNAIVRTTAEGTIDPTFIPQVASGLKYRGTFKPAVNDEYPAAGDNGSGAGGVPATGDFWVIDGLTTGGYTYLTGSLAGVTVYNGDSIAYDGTAWYRMGSSVSLQGYMKIDGSTAMSGALNMGTNDIVNVANITARSGTKPTVSGFSFDSTNVILSPQRGTSGPDLATMPAGQLGTDLGRSQLYVGASASNTPLIPVRYFSANSAYAIGEHVYEPASQALWRARSAITPGAFVNTQWSKVVDEYNGYFQANVNIVTASYPAVILRNTGNAVDKTRGGYSIENTTGDLTLGLTNDDNTVSHGGIRIGRAQGGALCPIVNAGGSLGYSLNRWSALYLAGNVDVSANVFTVQMSTPGGTNRYRLMTNTSDSFDGGCLIARWNGSAYEDKFIVKSEGVYQVHALPLNSDVSNVGSDAARFNFAYLKGGVEIKGDVSSITMSSAGLANRYRFLTNVSDTVDGGMGIQRWDGTAFQDQFVVRNLNALTRTLYPMFDNQYQCGGAGNRWTAVFAVNGTINTSDAREKITAPLTSAELDAGRAILDLFVSYRWRPELLIDDKRHYGATAQSVRDALLAAGLLEDQLGPVQYDQWEAIPPTVGPDGEEIYPGREAGDHYGLNYPEVHSLCLANLHQRLAALEAAAVPPEPETEF